MLILLDFEVGIVKAHLQRSTKSYKNFLKNDFNQNSIT